MFEMNEKRLKTTQTKDFNQHLKAGQNTQHLFYISRLSGGGLFTWPNQDDQMNLIKPWQRRTLTIQFDQIKTDKPFETD